MQSDNAQPRELKPEQKTAAHTLDQHLSVTAGPGAGKTFVLVERYLEILRAKKVSVDNIVAITFTNRAANEMRQRVRDRIDGLLRDSPDRERQTWLRHKRTLEGAVITTIHGFCSRLLHEFPVEANIDPQFVLLDEHQAAMLLESVVEEALADAIHHGNETILQFTQGTGRAALATALVELHRKYRGEGLSIETIEKLTAANHSTKLGYARALKDLDARMGELLSAGRLTKAAEEKRARAAQEWPALRLTLAQPPTEKTIARYTQAIEDFWDARPQKRSHPAIERIDELLWGDNPGVNDCLRGTLPAIGFDLLAKEYSLAVLKLLHEIDRRLDAEKQRLSVLDFDDLQLRALRLLDYPEVLARVSERYKYFLVDEFQDTNGLQRDLMTKLALVRGTNLFIVGDRKQSIYGFRGADVDVFTEMTTAIENAGGTKQPLHLNFRSQKPLIDSLNFLFAKIFEPRADVPHDALNQLGYVMHEPSIPQRGIEHNPPHVEFMVGVLPDETASANDSEPVFRSSSLAAQERDAEQVTARISALVGGPDFCGGSDKSWPEACAPHFNYKDIAILLRAFTGVWTYESALRRAGIPYLTVQGKGFYQREEITDLIQLLRFLDNTTDELALAAILRSPLGGISDNALLALRCAPWIEGDKSSTKLHRRNLLRAVRRHREIEFIDEDDQAALDRIAAWIESMIDRRNRYGIADLLRYAVASSEFLPIIAANFDGAQRVANVEKLFRLAEQFEKSGHLIRDFVHYVEEFEAIGGREGEGQMDEAANVVRLMTIHQAKGLEFPVVIIPDLHREPNRREAAFILDRHKGMTVRVPDGRGRSVRGALFNELGQRNRWREEFESMRLLYVAATRAEDFLILSGAIDRKSLENLTKTDREQWLAWIWRALDLEEHAPGGLMTLTDEAQIQITIDRESQASSFTRPLARTESPETLDPAQTLEETLPLLQPITAEYGKALRRFTVTQLINFQRCARQYYFERMLRTPGKEERAVWNDAEAPEPPANLTATLKGAVIHRFCETFRTGENVEARLTASFDDILAQRQAELVGRTFDINKAEAVRALMPLAENYLSSDVFRRVSAAALMAPAGEDTIESPRLKSVPHAQSAPGLWSELRFRLRRPNGILTGTIDKLLITPAANGEGVDVEIIDFKTNRFSMPARRTQTQIRTAVAARAAQVKVHANNPANATGQGLLNFESVADEVVTEEIVSVETDAPDASIEDQVARVANDYRLQMQGYALALRELLPDVRIQSLRATLHFIDPKIEFSVPASLLSETICADSIDEAMRTIALLEGTLDADQFPPLPATHCRTCNFLEMCPAGKEWLRQD
ncbi:MAG TPA: UvrD-helicase domain-containing protein [Pyrinomonadaceae bacterium]|nr:UvrD-helicase domain-containing protein [Pyrinomonadaceae bacterium]